VMRQSRFTKVSTRIRSGALQCSIVSRADPAVISAVVSTTDRPAGVVAEKAGSKGRVSSASSRKAPDLGKAPTT
jgi:hypothetical protein